MDSTGAQIGPHCGQYELVVYRKQVTDWSETNIVDRCNPFESTPKRYRVVWICRECSLSDQYYVPDDPIDRDEIEKMDQCV